MTKRYWNIILMPKMKRDDPALWAAIDKYNEIKLWAALQGKFNFKDDKKSLVLLSACDIKGILRLIDKRIKEVGKPKFKKLPKNKLGQTTVAGTMAYAGARYIERVYGISKPPIKAVRPKKVSKAKPRVKSKDKVTIVPNLDLPQDYAYVLARKKLRKNEELLYIISGKGDLQFKAIYYNKKTKSRRTLKIQSVHNPKVLPWEKQLERYAKNLKRMQSRKRRK